MKNLDDVGAMEKIDTENVLGSIEQVGLQCQQAWEDVKKIEFPNLYQSATSIVFAGMGGSALGAYVIKSLFFDELKLPFEIINGYQLPPYVNEKTLVIVCSYSGTTEEAISCAKEAVAKHSLLTGITMGKELADVLAGARVPSYIFEPKYNPSHQPRLGTGYTAFGQIAIMSALGLIEVTDEDVADVVAVAERGNQHYGASLPAQQNQAKQLALHWNEKIPIIVSAEFLWGVGRVIRNQFHECAKAFAAYHDIPELNHHLLEALTNPARNKEILTFLFLNSDHYSEKIKQRIAITKDVVTKQGMALDEVTPQSATKMSQAFECIQFGAYTNYYMATLYDVDPGKIPWVDYFKENLTKT